MDRRPFWPVLGVLIMVLAAISPLGGGAARAAETTGTNAPATLVDEMPARYVVQLAAEPLALYDGGVAGLAPTMPAARGELRLDPSSAASVAYYAYLDQQQALAIRAIQAALNRPVNVAFEYHTAFNGVALDLTATEAATVRGVAGVTRVERDEVLQTLTDHGPQWMNADDVWDGSATGTATKGEGIVAGIIDTGVRPDHPSFADIGGDGYDHTNPRVRFYGDCVANPFLCNDKLIGLYDFTTSGSADDVGHGSHTASTVAGNVVDATVYGPTTAVGPRRISGVAPHANIISYKACMAATFNPGGLQNLGSCPVTALIAAIDAATADVVDVINFSIGGGSVDPWTDLLGQPFFGTQAAGVFVAASAGNEGSNPQTIGRPSNSPWLMSVGASTHDRRPTGRVQLSGGAAAHPEIVGTSLTSSLASTPLIDAKSIGNELCNPFDAAGAAAIAGKVVVCTQGAIGRVAKGVNAKAAGAAGMVLISQAGYKNSVVSDTHVIPTVMIGEWDGASLREWLASGTGHAAALVGVSLDQDTAFADRMAGFSSRGPDLNNHYMIKPDVTAPGVSILAAWHVHSGDAPAGAAPYQMIQGTSMSSPHAAGAAALVRASNPMWTPDQVRSALVSTGFTAPNGGKETVSVTKEDHATPADPFDMGGGRVDIARAAKAALVMNENVADYQAANPALDGDPRQLNVPSFAHNSCELSCSWTRTLANAASTSVTWTATTTSSSGFSLSVTPASFTLGGAVAGLPISTQDITVTARNDALQQGVWEFGSVTFTPSDASIPAQRFPVAVRGAEAPVVPPCEIPETVVVTDPAGDQLSGHPSQDVREIGIRGAYPTFRGTPTPNLVFRMKVADLSELLPNSNLRTVFTVPGATPANWFVEMEVNTNGDVSFNYGNQTTGFSTLGAADFGEYSADGNVLITIATSKVGNPTEGATLAVYGRSETLIGAAGTGGLAQIDRAPNTGTGSYTVAGCGDVGPIANADRATTSEGTPVTIDVLANDTSSDGSALTITGASDPGNGTATVNGNGTVTYTPDAGFQGADSFTYTISDGRGRTASALVSVTVAPFCPTTSTSFNFETGSEGWSVETAENELGGTISPNWAIVTDLLAKSASHSFHSSAVGGTNEEDSTSKDDRLIGPAVDLTAVSKVSFWHRYWFEVDFDGGVVEVSTDAGETWRDVTDPNVGGVWEKNGYTGTISPGGSAIAGRDAFTGEESTAVTGSMRESVLSIGTLAGSTAIFRWRLVTDPLIPSIGWWVDDVTFSGLATDCNEPPVANADEAKTSEDTAVTIAVLANDTDPDNDALSVSGASDPANGTVVVNADNTVTYTPDAGFTGTDTFTYTAFDGEWEDTATVTVTVEERPNTAPVASNDTVTTARNTAVDIAVLANDRDADGDALRIASFTQPAQGWVTDNGNGTLRYTPPLNFSGAEVFSYTIDDSHGGSDTATVTVNVGEPGAPLACFATSPKKPRADQEIRFDARCTSDDNTPDDLLVFEWDFESDGIFDATGIRTTHTYAVSGTYTVTLRVRDPGGSTDVLKHDLTVRN